MSPLKRRLVHAGLVLFTAWPLAHMVLVRQARANPWKLGGWGMYATPQIPPELRVVALAQDGAGETGERDLPDAVRPVAERFLERRLGLGRLATPAALGRALLAEWPAVGGVRIEVVQPILDPRSGRLGDETVAYTYGRE